MVIANPGGGGFGTTTASAAVSPQATAQAAAAPVPSYPAWVTQFLTGLGAPVTADTVAATLAWQQCEGGLSNNNPFNTTLNGPGATGDINSVGVKSFDSITDGINANIQTILQSNMSDIRNALINGGGQAALGAALSQDPWGTNGDCVASAQVDITGASNPAAGSTSGSGSSSAPCLVKLPTISIPAIGSIGGNCLLTKPQAQEFLGGLIVVGGGVITLVGLVLLFTHMGGPAAAGKVASGFGPVGKIAGGVAKRVPDKNDRLYARSTKAAKPDLSDVQHNVSGKKILGRSQPGFDNARKGKLNKGEKAFA